MNLSADATFAGLTGGAEAGDIDPGPGSTYGVDAYAGYEVGEAPFGPGTIGRATTIIGGATLLLLFVYWRAAKGY